MNQVYTFHKTVRGPLHIINNVPCEDSSISFSSEDGKYHIAVVADGHGSKSCFRSEYGSKTATKIAFKYLQQFAEATLASEEIENRFYNDIFSNPRYYQMTLRQLTDTIIAGWYDIILHHHKDNPPTVEEMGESVAEYENEENVSHIYGTTVIAALQLPRCLILLQQGDGRCVVFYKDGTANQPIPWDSRCEDTVTTSLCDADVADSIRTSIIDLTEKYVIACYLGCDGVEDAYRDTYESIGGSHVLMGGVYTFFKDLTCQIAVMNGGNFEKYLEDMLPEFSANGRFSRSGSGDDVSVAGIVDVDAIQNFVEKFQYDVKLYALEEDLFWKQDELRSKDRKHDILHRRMKDAREALETAQDEQQLRQKKLRQLKEDCEEIAQEIAQVKDELEDCRRQSQSATEHLEPKTNYAIDAVRSFMNNLSQGYKSKSNVYAKLLEKLQNCNKMIRNINEKQNIETVKIQELENQLAEAQAAFSEYDAKYQTIEAEKKRIEKEITTLIEEKEES